MSAMHRREPFRDEWSVNALQRATQIGQRTYTRTLERKVEWPTSFTQYAPKPKKTLVPYTTLEEAFDTVQQFMVQTSKQCMRYYKSHPPREHQYNARCHCDRFHTQAYTQHLEDQGRHLRQASPGWSKQEERGSCRQVEPGCSRWSEAGCSNRDAQSPDCSMSPLLDGQKHCTTCYCAYIS